MKERLHYMDVAKGLLIFLVIIHHQPQLAREHGVSNGFLDALNGFSDYYNAFFMPAFFIITGYCTNFVKTTFKRYVVHQTTTIMLPAFCLGAVSVWISLIGKGCVNPVEYCKIGFKTFVLSGGAFWFLTALFISKLIYRVWLSALRRMAVAQGMWHDVLTGVFCAVLYVAGSMLHQYGVADIWWFEHGLMLTAFLYIGQLLRQYEMHDKLLMAGFSYTAVILCLQWSGIRHPYITAGLNAYTMDLPLLLLLSVSGSLMTLYVSKLINKNRLLEYLGRNSLIIYCLHISTLGAVHNMAVRMMGEETVATIGFSVLQLSLTVLLLLLFSWLLNKKYLRVLQGKF